jgi:putative peptidoglycan lipid II flippase
MRFLLPYLLGITAQVVQIAFLLFFTGMFGIHAVAIAATVASFLCLSVQIVFIRTSLGIRIKPRLWHSAVRPLAADSVSIRMGHQIWGLRDLITTNVLSHAPAGAISIFSYAMKIAAILFTVTNSPVLQIFQARASRLASERNFIDVRHLRREATIKNVLLFAAAVFPAVIFLPALLRAVFQGGIPDTSLNIIYFLFLALIPVHLLMSMEMPYVQVVIALKQGKVILRTGVLFIVAYFTLVQVGYSLLGIYGIPAAMLAAQVVNVAIYIRYVSRSFKDLQWNGEPGIS